MRETKSQEIDGITFHVQQLPAMRAMKLMHKLVKAVGPAMLKALGEDPAAAKAGLASMNVSALAEGASILFENFSDADLEALIRTLFETAFVTVDGQKMQLMPVFDDKLSGRPGTVLKGLKFALEVNYSDFFGEFLAGVGALRPAPPLKE
jgi:hypothetical protein